MKPRAEYLEANSLSRTKPWVAEGISRTTWYDRRKKGRTGLAAIHKNNALGQTCPECSRQVPSTEARLPGCLQAPDLCPFFIPERIPGAPNLIPYGRLISLAEIRASMGYRQ